MKKSVRLSDIAEKLQVSTVTVSNALAGQKGVSEELRELIKKTATEMGYQGRARTASAARNQILNIGVIISEKYLGSYPSYYWKIYQELSLTARDFNCVILFEVLHHETERQRQLPLFALEQKIQGLIVIGEVGGSYLKFLHESAGVPMVFVDFMKRGIPVPSIMADNFYGMYKMTRYLIERGHSRIAYVGTVMASNSIMDRYFGYCKALMEQGIAVREDWVIDDRTMEGQIMNVTLPQQMPTAFACNCDLTAGVVINQLKALGYRIPEDISVIGFDNYLFEGLCDTRITSYEVDIKEMVSRALKEMLAQVHHRRGTAQLRLVPGWVVEKESVSDAGDSSI